MNNEFEN